MLFLMYMYVCLSYLCVQIELGDIDRIIRPHRSIVDYTHLLQMICSIDSDAHMGVHV